MDPPSRTSSTPLPNPLSPSQSLPPWARRPSVSSSRRLSTRRNPYAQQSSTADPPLHIQLWRFYMNLNRQAIRLFLSLTPLYQVLVLLGTIAALTLTILALVYSHSIFSALSPVAQSWRNLPGGWILVWLMTFICAFPPMIGYVTAVTISGFVYGFPWGWPIVATATVAGSTAAFFTSRGVFSGYVHRLVGKDRRFVALGQVLRRDGLGVLTMIRFCPLPYSLSNGFLATVPSIQATGFAAATACATPKLAVHVFIGSRLALLAESGDKMTAGDKAINYASMVFGGTLGFIVGLAIYRRTMARVAELAAAEGLEEEDQMLAGARQEDGEYADGDGNLLARNGDVDTAALMDDDDISLWETDGVEDGSYHDSWDEEAAVEGTRRIGNGTNTTR